MTELMPMPEIERASDGDDAIDEADVAALADLEQPRPGTSMRSSNPKGW